MRLEYIILDLTVSSGISQTLPLSSSLSFFKPEIAAVNKHKVFPVPVGLSKRAFSPFFIAYNTLFIY